MLARSIQSCGPQLVLCSGRGQMVRTGTEFHHIQRIFMRDCSKILAAYEIKESDADSDKRYSCMNKILILSHHQTLKPSNCGEGLQWWLQEKSTSWLFNAEFKTNLHWCDYCAYFWLQGDMLNYHSNGCMNCFYVIPILLNNPSIYWFWVARFLGVGNWFLYLTCIQDIYQFDLFGGGAIGLVLATGPDGRALPFPAPLLPIIPCLASLWMALGCAGGGLFTSTPPLADFGVVSPKAKDVKNLGWKGNVGSSFAVGRVPGKSKKWDGTFEANPSDSKWVLVVYLVSGTAGAGRLSSALGLNNSFGVGIRTTAGLFGSEELSTLLELLVELESTDATSVVLSREEDIAKSLQVVVHKFHSYKLKHVCSSTSPTYLVT